MKKESRSLDIEWRVFQKKDIRRIAHELKKAFDKSKEEEHHTSISFQLRSEGGISYETDSTSLFDDGGPLDTKKTESLQLTYYDYTYGRSIDIALRESGYYSTLIVRGENPNWVQGKFTTIQELISSVQPQTSLVLKYKKYLLHLLAIGVGYIIFLILDFLIYQHIDPIENLTGFLLTLRNFFTANRWAAVIVQVFLYWMMGISTFTFSIYNWLTELWPTIEFDFGPEHMKLHKIRRQRVWVVISVIVIPIVVDAISRLI